jgi:hypothetical protein
VIQGPGISPEDCKSQTWDITPEMLTSMNATWGPSGRSTFHLLGSLNARLPAFNINVRPSYYATERAAARMEVGYVSWDPTLRKYFLDSISAWGTC